MNTQLLNLQYSSGNNIPFQNNPHSVQYSSGNNIPLQNSPSGFPGLNQNPEPMSNYTPNYLPNMETFENTVPNFQQGDQGPGQGPGLFPNNEYYFQQEHMNNHPADHNHVTGMQDHNHQPFSFATDDVATQYSVGAPIQPPSLPTPTVYSTAPVDQYNQNQGRFGSGFQNQATTWQDQNIESPQFASQFEQFVDFHQPNEQTYGTLDMLDQRGSEKQPEYPEVNIESNNFAQQNRINVPDFYQPEKVFSPQQIAYPPQNSFRNVESQQFTQAQEACDLPMLSSMPVKVCENRFINCLTDDVEKVDDLPKVDNVVWNYLKGVWKRTWPDHPKKHIIFMVRIVQLAGILYLLLGWLSPQDLLKYHLFWAGLTLLLWDLFQEENYVNLLIERLIDEPYEEELLPADKKVSRSIVLFVIVLSLIGVLAPQYSGFTLLVNLMNRLIKFN